MFFLALPWILLLLIALTVVLFICKKWVWGVGLLIFAIVLNAWIECIPLRLWSVDGTCTGRCLRVMSFNIQGTGKEFDEKKASEIVDLIKRYRPDVLFVSELNDRNLIVIGSLVSTSLPYSVFTKGHAHCFYSKYKLEGWEKLEREDMEHLGVYTCNLSLGGDNIRLYGCHFASNNYTSKKQYVTPDSIKNRKQLKTYLSDIKRAYLFRTKEAVVLKSELEKAEIPVILMGDLNDVGGSATVRILGDAGLSAAWWKGGFGYGATIHSPLPYRIDHIMFSDGLKLLKIKVIDSEDLSDHDALYAEIEY